MRNVWVMTVVFAHIVRGLATALVLRGRYGSQWYLSKNAARVIQRWMRRLARILKLTVRPTGQPSLGPVLYVANHISWLDIVALGCVLPAAYLAKRETRRWPVIGLLAETCGTLFIERGSKTALHVTVAALARRLRLGQSVVIFPEGTTTTGDEVKRFHAGMFAAPALAAARVQPVALRYGSGGTGRSPAPFVGDDTFVRHLYRVVQANGLDVELIFCSELEVVPGQRRTLADIAHAEISRHVVGDSVSAAAA